MSSAVVLYEVGILRLRNRTQHQIRNETPRLRSEMCSLMSQESEPEEWQRNTLHVVEDPQRPLKVWPSGGSE